ncbi:aspartyl/asparaginyl beta-hydroxylase domain-containing protein [Acidisphaera sp. S103]|uniref:aspartyl/asparaginyl beta-hydroxylase domain-containing protein n=1 Tax=Acidisphaera sp. S103 TaxID=1747223 RepID=UPI00131AAE93
MIPYLTGLISREFATDRLRWARLMRVAGNGCVIPHRDFLEFSQPFTRLRICLKTNPQAWNSEEGRLFHMRVGEVWHLDATRVHSAACFSPEPRVHLVLDFAGDNDPVNYLAHRRRAAAAAGVRPRPKRYHGDRSNSGSLGQLGEIGLVVAVQRFQRQVAGDPPQIHWIWISLR